MVFMRKFLPRVRGQRMHLIPVIMGMDSILEKVLAMNSHRSSRALSSVITGVPHKNPTLARNASNCLVGVVACKVRFVEARKP